MMENQEAQIVSKLVEVAIQFSPKYTVQQFHPRPCRNPSACTKAFNGKNVWFSFLYQNPDRPVLREKST